jgi:hypothetical protein
MAAAMATVTKAVAMAAARCMARLLKPRPEERL